MVSESFVEAAHRAVHEQLEQGHRKWLAELCRDGREVLWSLEGLVNDYEDDEYFEEEDEPLEDEEPEPTHCDECSRVFCDYCGLCHSCKLSNKYVAAAIKRCRNYVPPEMEVEEGL